MFICVHLLLLNWFVNISDESATIRVTNLSEDTRESDLQELFRPFGPIQRIYLAKDKNTGQSKVRLNTVHVVSLKHYHKTMIQTDTLWSAYKHFDLTKEVDNYIH